MYRPVDVFAAIQLVQVATDLVDPAHARGILTRDRELKDSGRRFLGIERDGVKVYNGGFGSALAVIMMVISSVFITIYLRVVMKDQEVR